MNSNFATQQQYPSLPPQQQQHAQQAPSIDPALLAAFRNPSGGGGGNTNKFPYGGGIGNGGGGMGGMNMNMMGMGMGMNGSGVGGGSSSNGAGGGFNNPQLMQQHLQAGGTLNPAHLMNGGGGGGQQQHGMNPQMFLQQQPQSQSQQPQQQHGGMMNGTTTIANGGGGGGINPAALNAHNNNSNNTTVPSSLPALPSLPNNVHAHAHSHGHAQNASSHMPHISNQNQNQGNAHVPNQGQNPNAHQNAQQQQQQQHHLSMSMAGMTREQMQQQYNMMSPQEKLIFQAKFAAAAAANSHGHGHGHSHSHSHGGHQGLLHDQQQQQHHLQQQQQQQQRQQQFSHQSQQQSQSQQSHSHTSLQQQQQQQHSTAQHQQQALQHLMNQQQQQQQQAAYYGADRPSSSASASASHPSSSAMMMPPPSTIPPARPPTTGPGSGAGVGVSPSSRPGTSHSQASPAQIQQQQRPPSRPTTAGSGFDGQPQQPQQQQFAMTNGYPNSNPSQPKPTTPQHTSATGGFNPHFPSSATTTAQSNLQQQQQQLQQYQHQLQQQQQQQHQHSPPPPPPGSPSSYRGSKRKVAGANGMVGMGMGMESSARVSGQQGGMMAGGGGLMGGPVATSGMSRQLSNSGDQQQHIQNSQQNHQVMMNGYPPQSQQQQQQQHQQPQQQQQQQPHQPNINISMHSQQPNGHGSPALPHAPISNGGMSAAMSMMNDPSRMNVMAGAGPMASLGGGGMNIGMGSGGIGIGGGVGMGGMNLGMGGTVDIAPRTPQRSQGGSQMPGYPSMSPMPHHQQQLHRQPQTPGFASPIPGNLQQPMISSPSAKQVLDPTSNMGGGGGGLPQLGSSGFPMLDPRPAGMSLPSRIASVAPPQLGAGMPPKQQPPSIPAVQPLLPPLPANVQLNPQVTRVSVVPLAGSDKAIPALSESEIKDIQAWRQTDRDYEGIWRKMKERMTEEIRTVTGPSKAAWWEKDAVDLTRRRPREPFDVRYPRQKRGDGRERRKTGRREGLRLPRKLKAEDANRPEQLVPIRLEFDVEHHKMRDSFVWNLNDPVVTPEAFAQSVVEDYGLAPNYHTIITKSIQDQLSDFRIHSSNPDGDFNEADADLVRGELDEEDAAWWESWRKRLRTTRGFIKSARRADSKSHKRKLAMNGGAVGSGTPAAELTITTPMDVDDIEVDESTMHEDMRILIKLDIVVGSMKLEDQFEWDLDNVHASPEQFAEVYGADLGLTGEYKTAIAHCIREQVQMYQKSLFLVGHPSDGSTIQDEDLRLSFLPILSSGARSMDQVGSFTPLLNYLSDGDIEREEKEREKEFNKRRKRNTRGRRGVALPDREPIRNHRTPAIGFPELDPSTLAAAVAASAPTSRRAAAAAASLTIANMVASENGTLHMPQTAPLTSQPAPSSSKEKKPKGLFKAPTYPSSVLRPRARVTAPTPSTAAESSSLSLPVDPDAPSTRTNAPDSRTSKVITAKRAKELEREAKEKEYADGQHANMIDGVWHCSNCGCPEDIAVGRRKGPLGDKSQCGTCGKYWHRHRRPMVVEYNSSAEFHLNKIKDAELARTVARKKGGAAALRAQNASSTAAGDDTETPSSPQNENGVEPLPQPSRPPTVPASEDDRAASPGSSTSSDSESPLAQKVSKVNGTNHAASAPPAPTPSGPVPTQPSQPVSQSVPPSTAASAPPATAAHHDPPNPPKWLWNATQAMRTKYPDDLFVLKRINGSEWRIKCSDCPGKLYTPGPGETLSNYEVHLKNRQHRQKVNDRKNGVVSQPH